MLEGVYRCLSPPPRWDIDGARLPVFEARGGAINACPLALSVWRASIKQIIAEILSQGQVGSFEVGREGVMEKDRWRREIALFKKKTVVFSKVFSQENNT